MRLCMDRLVPPMKDEPISVRAHDVPEGERLLTLARQILDELSTGKITPNQAATSAKVIQTLVQALKQSGRGLAKTAGVSAFVNQSWVNADTQYGCC